MFETVYYRVMTIDGDYAHLQNLSANDSEPKLVARALLPDEIAEGSRLKYEMMEYSIEENG